MAYSKKTKEKIAKLEKEIVDKDKTIKKLKDEFQNLNLEFKYNQFDVEATKRELEYYKKLLRDQE